MVYYYDLFRQGPKLVGDNHVPSKFVRDPLSIHFRIYGTHVLKCSSVKYD